MSSAARSARFFCLRLTGCAARGRMNKTERLQEEYILIDLLEYACPAGEGSLSALMAALERGAVTHAEALDIGYERMLRDFNALWMVVRARLCVTRLPVGKFTVQTWLRKPTAAMSLREFALSDAGGAFGAAVQTWVLADAGERKLLGLKAVPPIWALPTRPAGSIEALRHLNLPEQLRETARWTVAPEEIDNNGHLNNVAYVRRAEALAPAGCTGLEVVFDRECFAGETLRLETGGDFFVRGVKESGEESFRARFFNADGK